MKCERKTRNVGLAKLVPEGNKNKLKVMSTDPLILHQRNEVSIQMSQIQGKCLGLQNWPGSLGLKRAKFNHFEIS